MSTLVAHAAWVLTVTFGISLVYELYRATARAGASQYDSMRAFVQQLVMYVIAAAVIAGLFADLAWAPWVGLVLSVVMILVSILYYNPTIMPAREPVLVDWVEDLLFTGLLFVAAVLLAYEVLGMSLVG